MTAQPCCLVEMLAGLRSGELTHRTIVDAALHTAHAMAPLNAFITIDDEGARRAADAADDLSAVGSGTVGSDAVGSGAVGFGAGAFGGALRGIPIVVKDNIHVAGLPNTAATGALAGFVPTQDAPVVRRLRSAGAIVLAKTNMHELAFGITSAESAYGPVRNAHDPRLFAGGSSGGTAVALARGIPAGLGTDTGGSVRIPAALNGVCGLRPTVGRYPAEAVTPLSATRDTVGPIAHCVADLALLDAVLAGQPPTPLATLPAADLRLGLLRCCDNEPLGPETARAFTHAIGQLRARVTIIDVALPLAHEVEATMGFPITLYEAAHGLANYLARYQPRLGMHALTEQITGRTVERVFHDFVVPGAPHAISHTDYRAALAGRARLIAAYRDLFTGHGLDALIFPTTPRCAGELALADQTHIDVGGQRRAMFDTFIRHTAPGTLAGLPGLTIPLPVPPGVPPVGLALDAPPGTDRTLLSIGLTLEHLLASDRPEEG